MPLPVTRFTIIVSGSVFAALAGITCSGRLLAMAARLALSGHGNFIS